MGSCRMCRAEFPQTVPQRKYCSVQCRYEYWVRITPRETRNARTRKYRRERYQRDGFWRETSPKARANKEWMLAIKSPPCQDCSRSFPACCMDFDHREGTVKKYNIGTMFAHHYSRELIESELVKCDLVCSNCHRIRTQKRLLGSKLRKAPNHAPA